jgi:alpha-D-ribose 1-methylphosphonate 5-triphosphate synthase subunit PhnH
MTALAAGFANHVFDSQAVFRSIMRSMAQPGRVDFVVAHLQPPEPLNPAAAAACLALADFETPLWLSPSLARVPEVAEYLRFHCGASVASHPTQAAFVLVDVRTDAVDLASFAQGTAEYPDRGATVILICETLPATHQLVITGPGLRGEGSFGFQPIPTNFMEQWQSNRDAFPLGVDLIVTAGDRLACLPRSSRILRETA